MTAEALDRHAQIRAEAREQFIAGLRRLADLMDAHPEIPVPPAPYMGFYPHADERAVVDIFEGLNLDARTVEVDHKDEKYGFKLRGMFGPIQIHLAAEPAKVCTPIGQKVVTTYEYSPAPAATTPAAQADGHPEAAPPVAAPGAPETAGAR